MGEAVGITIYVPKPGCSYIYIYIYVYIYIVRLIVSTVAWSVSDVATVGSTVSHGICMYNINMNIYIYIYDVLFWSWSAWQDVGGRRWGDRLGWGHTQILDKALTYQTEFRSPIGSRWEFRTKFDYHSTWNCVSRLFGVFNNQHNHQLWQRYCLWQN